MHCDEPPIWTDKLKSFHLLTQIGARHRRNAGAKYMPKKNNAGVSRLGNIARRAAKDPGVAAARAELKSRSQHATVPVGSKATTTMAAAKHPPQQAPATAAKKSPPPPAQQVAKAVPDWSPARREMTVEKVTGQQLANAGASATAGSGMATAAGAAAAARRITAASGRARAAAQQANAAAMARFAEKMAMPERVVPRHPLSSGSAVHWFNSTAAVERVEAEERAAAAAAAAARGERSSSE